MLSSCLLIKKTTKLSRIACLQVKSNISDYHRLWYANLKYFKPIKQKILYKRILLHKQYLHRIIQVNYTIFKQQQHMLKFTSKLSLVVAHDHCTNREGPHYFTSLLYYRCVHLLNIYRNISQNDTIGYSNNTLLFWCSQDGHELPTLLFKQFWKEVGRDFPSLASLLPILLNLSWSCCPGLSPHTPHPAARWLRS